MPIRLLGGVAPKLPTVPTVPNGIQDKVLVGYLNTLTLFLKDLCNALFKFMNSLATYDIASTTLTGKTYFHISDTISGNTAKDRNFAYVDRNNITVNTIYLFAQYASDGTAPTATFSNTLGGTGITITLDGTKKKGIGSGSLSISANSPLYARFLNCNNLGEIGVIVDFA